MSSTRRKLIARGFEIKSIKGRNPVIILLLLILSIYKNCHAGVL